ncbi:ABC transporter permease subunit [Phycicoccus sp. M110.8]|uniref:ABC transporter permease n=1 Tax=Phycicoccus sp. M110.8 TaxID=3075433 RepID=UPI0028FD87EB|nr:ABC transporter permease subunit [Phycicoccus sp. M110.8]MDU0313981.1 ABC transporter permease subunit [Phycicoccus sp. M110.8]
MSWHGIRTVAALELRQRARTSRWPVVLGIWFVVIALVAFLAYYATRDPDLRSGRAMYDVVVFFVLGLAMLIVPSLTATSVNGDREHGVLATLQTTLLTHWDLVVGKLLAAWLVAMAFLAASLPFLVWAWAVGGVAAVGILLSLLVLVLVLAVVCAVGLMFSTLTARPVASAVLTYLAMGALVFGTAIGFGLSVFLVTDKEPQRVHGIPANWYEAHQPPAIDPSDPNLTPEQLKQLEQAGQPTAADCVTYTRTQSVSHTERIWWMLPLNPFVVVADAAPSRAPNHAGADDAYVGGFTPMRWIAGGARTARKGPDAVVDECRFATGDATAQAYQDPFDKAFETGPVWPYGLGFLLVLGAGATTVAARRLRTPVRRLPNGTRIA